MKSRTPAAGATRAAGIDWREIHKRLEATSAMVERRLTPSAAERARIMKARALAMARERGFAEAKEEALEVVEFRLADESYALESSFVREVYPLRDLTPLPGVPAFVAGIINLRGQIVSVVDLKALIELPAKGLTDLNKVILLGDKQIEFGLLVDMVTGVRRIPIRDIQASLPTLTGVRAEYLRGLCDNRLVVLDAAKLLANPRFIVSDDG
ncbi:MAG: chemotaxis protein CheW [Steroidobacteraceae bacterium]